MLRVNHFESPRSLYHYLFPTRTAILGYKWYNKLINSVPEKPISPLHIYIYICFFHIPLKPRCPIYIPVSQDFSPSSNPPESSGIPRAFLGTIYTEMESLAFADSSFSGPMSIRQISPAEMICLDREGWSPPNGCNWLMAYLYVCVYIYIYVYIIAYACICNYIYIYIYICMYM